MEKMEMLMICVSLMFLCDCSGNVWNRNRPLYVIERFSLPDTKTVNNFPLQNSGSAVPFKITPLENVLGLEKPNTSALMSKSPESKSVTSPLPKLVKEIPTEHKVKIQALHPPCHKTGCGKGSQCVYDRVWMCPTYIPDLHCYCRPGCKVGNIFIPMGKTLTMDDCGNKCACLEKDGEAVCTKQNCTKAVDKKEEKMDSLLKYLKKLVKIKLQDRERASETKTSLPTSASGNAQHRKTTSKDIKVSRKIDIPTETRFPYNPHRTRAVYVRT